MEISEEQIEEIKADKENAEQNSTSMCGEHGSL